MTAVPQTCYTLKCDECDDAYTNEDQELHFESDEAIRFDALEFGEWSRDGDRDLCPTCTCARIGHRKRISSSGLPYAYCERCDETLLDSITAKPNEAYL